MIANPGVSRSPLSHRDFAALGEGEVAYVKRVAVEGGIGYAAHSVDGRPILTAATRDLAFAAVFQNDLHPIDAH